MPNIFLGAVCRYCALWRSFAQYAVQAFSEKKGWDYGFSSFNVAARYAEQAYCERKGWAYRFYTFLGVVGMYRVVRRS
eukprot:14932001-Alexandrium_andersonii.AAC.1